MRKTWLLILLPVLIYLMSVSLVAAQTNIGFMGIGGKLGYVKPEDIDGTFGLGFLVDLGTITPLLRLEGNVDYWSKSYDDDFRDLDADWKYSDLSFGATTKYFFPTQGNVNPYAGGGLAIHIFSRKWESEEAHPVRGRDWDDSETDIGFHMVGGIETDLSPQMKGAGEFRYTIADPNNWGIFCLITYLLKP